MTTRGQLDIFTKRVRKPPLAPEFTVHAMVADTLRVSLTPGWLWFHVPNGGERPAFVNKHGKRISIEGGRMQRLGLLPGVADILLVAPPGACLHGLELKRRGKRPDDDQIAFGEALRAAGGQFEWADNFDDALRVLKDWGAIRVRL